MKLTRVDKKTKDTLVINELKIVESILDSLCEHRDDRLVRHALDSIIAVQKRQEERFRMGVN